MKRATLSILLGSSLSLSLCISSSGCGNKGALTLVTPSSSFPSRSVDVQISGAGTAFVAGSTVELGDPAITVKNTAVASDGNIRATLDIAATARLGEYDVTVRSGGESLMLSKGFKVAASFKSDVQSTMVQQGSLFQYAFLNLDYVVNPLDQFARLTSGLSSVPGTNNVGSARMSGMALADVMAPPGAVTVQASSLNPLEEIVTFVSDPADAAAPVVTARSPMPLSPGVLMANQLYPMPRSNNLYSFTSSAADQVAIVQFGIFGTGFTGPGGTAMQGAFAPADGKWSSGQFADSSTDGQAMPTRTMLGYLPAAGAQFLTTFPTSFNGSANHTYTLGMYMVPGTRISMADATTRDSGTTPVAAIAAVSSAQAQFATDGQTEDALDNDYIRYSATSGTNRVYIQLIVAGASASISEYPTGDCSGTATTSANQSNVATIEVAAVPGAQHCIRVRASSVSTFPYPYRVIIAAR